jgi:hypothetical protein
VPRHAALRDVPRRAAPCVTLPAPPRCPTRAHALPLPSRPCSSATRRRPPLCRHARCSWAASRRLSCPLAGGSQAPLLEPLHTSPDFPRPPPLHCVLAAPPLKGCYRRSRWDPPSPPRVVFSPPLRRHAAMPSLASASSRRTTPEDAATLPEPPSTGTPSRRSLPATPPSPDLLGEPRLRSSCPVHPLRDGGALTENLVAG